MDLRFATLKAVSFYLLHNVSTLNQDMSCCSYGSYSSSCLPKILATKFNLHRIPTQCKNTNMRTTNSHTSEQLEVRKTNLGIIRVRSQVLG
jgi:hypothetical protein